MEERKEILKKVKGINAAAGNLRLSYQRLEWQFNKLIEETENLIEELEELTFQDKRPADREIRQKVEIQVSLEDCRGLIGNQVRIINPTSGEPNLGTIKSVGKFFVTIAKTNGDTTKRAAKNVRLIRYE